MSLKVPGLFMSAAFAFLAVAQPATAAPAPFESFRATCLGYGETRITIPGKGPFNPAFIEDMHQVLVTYAIRYTVVGGGTTTTAEADRSGPLPADATTCSFSFRFAIDGVLYMLAGEVTGVVVGEPRP